MARAKQERRVQRYSVEFKLSAVKLSKQPGVLVQEVAEALDIHPFMLSRWRKEAREGRLRGRGQKIGFNRELAAELKQLTELQRRYALLQQEHALLKKAIRFCSQARRRSSPSLTLRVVSNR
jgi:transposase